MQVIQCDICGKVERSGKSINFLVFIDNFAKREINEICYECETKISNVIAEMIKEIERV